MSTDVVIDAGIARAARHLTTDADTAELVEHTTRLPLPVKLEHDSGGRLRLAAEIACNGDSAVAARVAAKVLDAAHAPLQSGSHRRGLEGWERLDAGKVKEALAESLDALGWSITGSSDEQLRVSGGGSALEIEVSTNGFVLLRQNSSVLRCADATARDALSHFALEANARLRLARVGLQRSAEARVLVSWEAVVQAGPGLEHTLDQAREATAVARDATVGAMRALTNTKVAAAYLSLRRRAGEVRASDPLPGTLVTSAGARERIHNDQRTTQEEQPCSK